MSALTVIYWRDIPTQVTQGSGRRALKRPLPDRFLVAVDRAAMRSGATSTDDYLEDWRREPVDAPDGDDPIETLAAALEASYPATRLAALADRGGYEEAKQ